jgi:hypothetical protein
MDQKTRMSPSKQNEKWRCEKMFSSENTDKQVGRLTEYPESFRPIDRNELSETTALSLIDRYRIDNANDPMATLVAIVDKMNANQREAVSQFEAATALAGVEFGRIDLAIGKAEEIQKRVEALVKALDKIQKDFTLATDKIRERSTFDIVLNHLTPFIYGVFGAIITLLVVFVILRLRIL